MTAGRRVVTGMKSEYHLGKAWERGGWILGRQHLGLLQKLVKQSASMIPIHFCVIVLCFVII